jgi:hypothetical protein
MTFRQLRRYLTAQGPQAVRWLRSGIVEVAEVTPNGAVRITNVVSGRAYTLPRCYSDVQIALVPRTSLVPLGALLPKRGDR